MSHAPVSVRLTRRAAIAACTALLGLPVLAQGDAARIVVGFTPGGSTDTVARILAEKLGAELKRQVLVENKPGAGGRLAAAALKTLPADGSVVMLGPDSLLSTNPFIFKRLTYTEADLVPVGMVTEFAYAFATGPATGARTFAEYRDWLKQNPQKTDFGSPAAGSPLHFTGLLLGRSLGVDMVHVPFQGGAPLVTALAGGQLAAGINTVTDMLEMHKSGRIRVLAVGGAKRSSQMPDVPTFSELGLRDVDAKGHFGIYAPPGTPATAIAQWNAALGRVLADPAVRDRLATLGMEAKPSSPQELAAANKRAAAVWQPVIAASGFSAD